MIKIAICCGEGFASGFLSRHLTEAVVKEQLQDEVQFVFIPYYQLYDRQSEVDIAMALPHIYPQISSDQKEYSIPIYIIVYKVVIKPTAREYLEDAEDIIAIADGKGGVTCFPGEERFQFVSRMESHRRWEAKQK